MGREYEHAPIFEAIVEFRVTAPADVTLDPMSNLDFGERFGDPRPVYQLDGEIEVVDGEVVPRAPTSDPFGFITVRDDEQRTVQFGPERFAYTWRTGYTTWHDFLAEVESAWLIYRAVADPVTIDLVGVRFVNQIPLPEHRAVEIKDYLRISVDVPAHLPQAVSSLFMQIVMPLPDHDAEATITSALLPAAELHLGGGLLLDIDVKTRFGMSTNAGSFDDSLRSTLNRLRFAKNFVFEACITDATRGLIG